VEVQDALKYLGRVDAALKQFEHSRDAFIKLQEILTFSSSLLQVNTSKAKELEAIESELKLLQGLYDGLKAKYDSKNAELLADHEKASKELTHKINFKTMSLKKLETEELQATERRAKNAAKQELDLALRIEKLKAEEKSVSEALVQAKEKLAALKASLNG
jgi:hypothetical protein